MTKAERKKRLKYLPGGIKFLEESLADMNGGVSPIRVRAIGMILRGERGDGHGVIELFKEITTAEKERRERVAKEFAKELTS